MPIRKFSSPDFEYYLIAYDADGKERQEPNGTLLSDRVNQRASDSAAPISDVFFASHGWMGDVEAAIEQYDRWFHTMAMLPVDLDAARQSPSGFMPLIVGLHWPSLPWGGHDIGRVLDSR